MPLIIQKTNNRSIRHHNLYLYALKRSESEGCFTGREAQPRVHTWVRIKPQYEKTPPEAGDVLGIVGGETGIRTQGTLSGTHAFQACSFDHSDISPFLVQVKCIKNHNPAFLCRQMKMAPFFNKISLYCPEISSYYDYSKYILLGRLICLKIF